MDDPIIPFGIEATLQAERERCPYRIVREVLRFAINDRGEPEETTEPYYACRFYGTCRAYCPVTARILRLETRIAEKQNGTPRQRNR